VQDKNLYVKANFKETQVAKFKIGDRVKLKFDSLPKLAIYGKIRSLSPGTGSTFSLMPTDNAVGNFTKIVQRVPVIIDFDYPEDANDCLVAGMSVEVSVRTDQKRK
jgi:membrane fusion protein (multidrug efflux system)